MTKEKSKFYIGQVVILASGGPDMTVDEFYDETTKTRIGCTWFDGSKLKSAVFAPEALRPFGVSLKSKQQD